MGRVRGPFWFFLFVDRVMLMTLKDTEFIKVDQATVFDLILGANYLNIKRLLDPTNRHLHLSSSPPALLSPRAAPNQVDIAKLDETGGSSRTPTCHSSDPGPKFIFSRAFSFSRHQTKLIGSDFQALSAGHHSHRHEASQSFDWS
ncbi:hypothetical protein ACFX19_019109 [Malus domestica]